MIGTVFKAYDVRATYPDPLNETIAWRIGYGASRFLLDEAARDGDSTPMMRTLVLGRDMRQSSPSLASSLAHGVTDQGGSIIDVGMVDTPFMYYAINRLNCAGGVMTTASHNPPQYNGFKISRRSAKPVGEGTGLEEVRRQSALVNPDKTRTEGGALRIEQRDLWDAYIKHVRSFLDLGGAKLKIVIDASNGMAGTAAPRVFGERGDQVDGLDIIELHFDNSKGTFAHPPDPLVKANLRDLQECVIHERANLGVCFDGDGDRCMIVDERGEVVGCDHLTAWLAGWFLKREPRAAIAYDLRSSKATQEEIDKAGGKGVRSRVGHVFMKSALAKNKAVFGGELSGHFYFRDHFNCDSGLIALSTILTALASDGRTVSEIIRPIARYAQSGEINFSVEEKDAAMEAMAERYLAVADIDELDGVTVDCFKSKGWWCNVRKSNTEPLLRLNLEARTPELMQRMVDEISPLLGERTSH